MSFEKLRKEIEAQRVKYTGFAISSDEKKALPVGAHYFKCIFDDVEGGKDVFGYYRTFKEAVKASKAFARIEIEYMYAEEFDIWEYEVTRDEAGQFKGRLIAKYTNECTEKSCFDFVCYQRREQQ